MKNVTVFLTAVLFFCFLSNANAQDKNKIRRHDVHGVLYVGNIPFTGSFSTFCKIEENCPPDADEKRFIVLPNFGVPNTATSVISVSIYLQDMSDRRWYRVAFIQKPNLDKLGTIVGVINTPEDRVVVSGSNNVEILFHKTTAADAAITWVQVR